MCCLLTPNSSFSTCSARIGWLKHFSFRVSAMLNFVSRGWENITSRGRFLTLISVCWILLFFLPPVALLVSGVCVCWAAGGQPVAPCPSTRSLRALAPPGDPWAPGPSVQTLVSSRTHAGSSTLIPLEASPLLLLTFVLEGSSCCLETWAGSNQVNPVDFCAIQWSSATTSSMPAPSPSLPSIGYSPFSPGRLARVLFPSLWSLSYHCIIVLYVCLPLF